MSNQIELKAFGERVRTKRIELGLSQEAFAKKCGYTDRSSIAKIEKGEIDVSRSKIVAIASVLGVSPAYLMGWDESNTNHGVTTGLSVITTTAMYSTENRFPSLNLNYLPFARK